MKIYNSLTRKKEEFKPIEEKKIGIYVCGPTVYDEPHIGHARSAYIFDCLRRYLEYIGNEVTFVRNVTDVDDKIINKAKSVVSAKGGSADLCGGSCQLSVVSLKDSVKEISGKYLDAYHEDMALLGIGKPDKEPRATEYIPKMIKFIELLIKNGCAYESEGDVYFDIRKAKDYGKLSNQNLEKMEAGARIASGDKKRDPLDFALWKKAKEDEPSWPSRWGPGRPGWHIECSVMSSDILGDEFDIHGGGIDLIFPHHENEIAQSEGAGLKFARYWIHNGLLTIKGEKMAKSLGNFISIKDFIAKYKDASLLKLLFLGTHYRHPVDYTEDKIKKLKSAKETIQIFVQNAERALIRSGMASQIFEHNSYKQQYKYKHFKEIFAAAMDDDLDTPGGLEVIFICVHDGNKILAKDNLGNNDYEDLAGSLGFIKEVTKNIFGIQIEQENTDDKNILEKIQEREEARNKKDFKKADDIRKKLASEGVIIEDTKDGTVWRKRI